MIFQKHFLLIFLMLSGMLCQAQNDVEKRRVLVLTDIENEPDDTQSMVRFLLYSNHWDVEGLIATTSIHQKSRVAPDKIKQLINAYGKVRNNLLLHEKGYPTTEYLLSVTKSSIPEFGMSAIGKDKDSEGSDWTSRTGGELSI